MMRPTDAVNNAGNGAGGRLGQATLLPAWLATFIRDAERENETLTENGAAHAVAARVALLNRLRASAREYLDTEITVEEAAALLGRHPETIRRAVRNGSLPDGRAKARGNIRIRRGALENLAATKRGTYDPIADAQDIAQRRSK
jgi:excisionase family DNA binding protein